MRPGVHPKKIKSSRPVLYVIGGCNGAGKTTFAREFLPGEVKCLRFLNADEIARGLSPLKPEAAGVKAGRILLGEIRECMEQRHTFALESTLSGKTYIRLFREAQERGYILELHYLWLSNPSLAIRRVRSGSKRAVTMCLLKISAGGIPAVCGIW